MVTDKDKKRIETFLKDYSDLGNFTQKLRQMSDEELLKYIEKS